MSGTQKKAIVSARTPRYKLPSLGKKCKCHIWGDWAKRLSGDRRAPSGRRKVPWVHSGAHRTLKNPSEKSEKITKSPWCSCVPTGGLGAFRCLWAPVAWRLPTELKKTQGKNPKKSWKVLLFVCYHFEVVSSKINEFGTSNPVPNNISKKEFENQNEIFDDSR